MIYITFILLILLYIYDTGTQTDTHIYTYIYIFIFASSNKYKNIALVKFSTKFSGLTKKTSNKITSELYH